LKIDSTQSAGCAYVGCYGHFRVKDPICRHYCAISIRCAIERDKNMQVELQEDYFSLEDLFFANQ
jgi:hypothetical protein